MCYTVNRGDRDDEETPRWACLPPLREIHRRGDCGAGHVWQLGKQWTQEGSKTVPEGLRRKVRSAGDESTHPALRRAASYDQADRRAVEQHFRQIEAKAQSRSAEQSPGRGRGDFEHE